MTTGAPKRNTVSRVPRAFRMNPTKMVVNAPPKGIRATIQLNAYDDTGKLNVSLSTIASVVALDHPSIMPKINAPIFAENIAFLLNNLLTL